MAININYLLITFLYILVLLIIIYLVYRRIKYGTCYDTQSSNSLYSDLSTMKPCYGNGDIISSFDTTLPYYPDQTATCCPRLEDVNVNISTDEKDKNKMNRICRRINKNFRNCGMAGQDIYDPSISFDGKPAMCCDGGVPINGRCSDCSGILDSCDMGNVVNNKKIIVIRHGHDKDNVDNYRYTGGIKYKAYLPNYDEKEYGLQWLSKLGCKEAAAYAVALPKFIKEQGYSPIVKVFTQDPDVTGGTSNPFRTIYNFITNCDIKDVVFTRPEVKTDGKIYNNDITYNTDKVNGSVIMCYTSQAISGMQKTTIPEEGSIFKNLMKSMNIKDSFKGPPCKGTTLYVFSYGKVELFHLDINNEIILPGLIDCVKEKPPVY